VTAGKSQPLDFVYMFSLVLADVDSTLEVLLAFEDAVRACGCDRVGVTELLGCFFIGPSPRRYACTPNFSPAHS
jgi:hypothetical protein